MSLSESCASVFKNAFIRIAMQQLIDPYHTEQISQHLGQEHTPINRERVAGMLGEDAAKKWDDLRLAIAAFEDIAK